jgi:hypothetical protein
MSEKVTGESLVKSFQNLSKQNNKIFVASSLDDTLALNIVAYFNDAPAEYVDECIETYMRTTRGAGVSLRDFIDRLSDVKDEVRLVRENRETLKVLLENTKRYLEGT